jgi:hypothetical protein
MDDNGLVTITKSEYDYLKLRDEFLEHAFDLIPNIDDMWFEYEADWESEQ